MTPEHLKYMRRCLELAASGICNAAPNPMVGCVIVKNGQIIGEGYHQKFGEAHAEVNAVNSLEMKDIESPGNATLYVNLEPCCYQGKTPPCTKLIIKHKIPYVVVGCLDPNPKVSGKGIEKLKQAGCNVQQGVLEDECMEFNRRFFTFCNKKRPYIILKWAQTKDGFIARKRTGQVWISNELSRTLVHKWRSEEQSIMVGTNTAMVDNPKLSVREWKGSNPLRIVIDRSLKLPQNLHLFDNSAHTVVFTETKKNTCSNPEYIHINFDNDTLQNMMNELYKKNILSVIIEGGAALLKTFISQNLWDEARVITGNKTFGEGIKAPVMQQQAILEEQLEDDKLIIYRNHGFIQ